MFLRTDLKRQFPISIQDNDLPANELTKFIGKQDLLIRNTEYTEHLESTYFRMSLPII